MVQRRAGQEPGGRPKGLTPVWGLACQSSPEIRTSASGAVPFTTASASSAVKLSTVAEMFMEQNFGPHIEQKCASLKPFQPAEIVVARLAGPARILICGALVH